MNKKTLGIVASGLVGMLGLTGPVLSTPSKKFDVPEYSLKKAKKYEVPADKCLSRWDAIFSINKESVGDLPLLLYTYLGNTSYLPQMSMVTDYFIDRDKDKKTDLIYEKISLKFPKDPGSSSGSCNLSESCNSSKGNGSSIKEKTKNNEIKNKNESDLEFVVLYIDDVINGEHDGYLDRVLIDYGGRIYSEELGYFGGDGKFDAELRWLDLDNLGRILRDQSSTSFAAQDIFALSLPQRDSLGTSDKIEVPTYSLDGAEKSRFYGISIQGSSTATTIEPPIDSIMSEGTYREYYGSFPYLELTNYSIDRNKDGKVDLMHQEIIIPAKFTEGQKSEKAVALLIDDSGDGYLDRIIYDLDDKAEPDGIFNYETRWLKLEDLKPKK